MKLRIYVETGIVGGDRESIIEVLDEELEGLTEEQRQATLEEIATDEFNNLVSWGWEEVTE